MIKRRYPEAPITAVAALIVRNDHVLLTLRHNPPRAGRWSFPGGVQELGETLEAAVRREVQEETGLTLTNLSLLDVGDLIFCDDERRVEYHYVITYFLACPEHDRLSAGDDVDAVRWFALDEVKTLEVSERFLRLTQRALEHTMG
jgi:ADP-ribose pyrophosphatase YjhB (NUDIX family)